MNFKEGCKYKSEIPSTKFETNPNDKKFNVKNIKPLSHLSLRNSLIGYHSILFLGVF